MAYQWLPWLGVLFVVAAVAVRTLLSPCRYRLAAVKRRYPNRRRQAIHYYRDILRQLRLLGYPLRRGDTLFELTARFDEGETRPVYPSADRQIKAYHAAMKEMKQEPASYRAEVPLKARLAESTLSPCLRQTVADVSRRLQPVMELVYAEREPSAAQVEELYRLRNELEEALQLRLNPFVYIFHRRILLPSFSFVTNRYK